MSEREGRNDESSKLRPWRLKPTSKVAVWGQLWPLVSPGWNQGLLLNFKKESRFSVSVCSFQSHVWRPDTSDFTVGLILEQMYDLSPSQKGQQRKILWTWKEKKTKPNSFSFFILALRPLSNVFQALNSFLFFPATLIVLPSLGLPALPLSSSSCPVIFLPVVISSRLVTYF